MATIDFSGSVCPDKLAEEAAYADLLETIRGLESVRPYVAQVFDYIYRFHLKLILVGFYEEGAKQCARLQRLISAGAWSKDPLDNARWLADHLERVCHVRHAHKLSNIEGVNYHQRWLGYLAIVEDAISDLRK